MKLLWEGPSILFFSNQMWYKRQSKMNGRRKKEELVETGAMRDSFLMREWHFN